MNFPILSSLILLPTIGALFILFSRSSSNYNSAKYISLFIYVGHTKILSGYDVLLLHYVGHTNKHLYFDFVHICRTYQNIIMIWCIFVDLCRTYKNHYIIKGHTKILSGYDVLLLIYVGHTNKHIYLDFVDICRTYQNIIRIWCTFCWCV